MKNITEKQTVSFQEIKDYAIAQMNKINTTRFSIISFYPYTSDFNNPMVILNFTLFGDYVGSTVEKSNYYVLQERIKKLYWDNYQSQDDYDADSIFNISESYHNYNGGFGARAIAIVGDLPVLDWQVILESIDAVQEYPLLDDLHHSEIQQEDCWESWESWQFDDIARELEKYNCDMFGDEVTAIAFKECNGDIKTWLWNIINDCEEIPATDNTEILEVNATAYWDFDAKNEELMRQLSDRVNQLIINQGK